MKAVCANPACGKEFDSRNGAKTCSGECRKEFRRILGNLRYRRRREQTVKTGVCSVCGAAFSYSNGKRVRTTCGGSCALSAKRLGDQKPGGALSWNLDRCPYEYGDIEPVPYGGVM